MHLLIRPAGQRAQVVDVKKPVVIHAPDHLYIRWREYKSARGAHGAEYRRLYAWKILGC